VSRIVLAAAVTGFAAWALAAWVIADRLLLLGARIGDERRRRKNARRFAGWKPP
jgi:hypothetical protein